LPTAWYFVFQLSAGNQTSILMSESLVGVNVAVTRQNAGATARKRAVAGDGGGPGGTKAAAATDSAAVTVACGIGARDAPHQAHHRIVRGLGNERALLRRHPTERIFGVQLAGKVPAVMAEAARIAEQSGADFVDVNLGCPIDDATRRGFGAALLRRASRVAEIVSAMKAAVAIPVTIKLRLGWSSEKPTFLKVARAAEEAGVDAVTLHARSRAQRYRRPADWSAVAELREALSVPVVGNGDVFTWRDARRHLEATGCAGIMVGRWALAKPWIFREFAHFLDQGRKLPPPSADCSKESWSCPI